MNLKVMDSEVRLDKQMSLYNYVETPNTNLICCICRAPFTDPTTAQTCAHTFCHECILRALSHSSVCPVDRSPLSLVDLRPANPIVCSLVDELQVECIHRQEGCLHTCQRQMMSLHLRDDCEYGEAQCPMVGCDALLRRREVANHVEKMHGEGKNDVEVTNGGEDELKDNEEEAHICPHAALGCPYRGPQKPSDHLSSCPYESLKWFFTTSNTAKISLLTEQNLLLRHRLDATEAMVRTLRKEMNAVRNALGPWFSSSYQVGGVRGLDVGVGLTSSVWRVGMPHSAAGPSQPTSAGEDPLAPYFPPAESMVQRPPIDHRSPSSTVGDTSDSRTGMMGVVAPLDLSTTLEGTLVGLRESMMGLAVGIDSVGRRSEIGLTNETLRLGEEMMSVRAQIHGLRMQMHGMMMDRNAALRSEEGQYFQPPVLPPPPPPNRNFGVPPSITKL